MKTFSVFSLLALPLFVGCAAQPPVKETPPVAVADRPAAAPVDVGIEWNWRIVGDAATRPVQVFSMNGQTYLHMRDRRPVVLLVGGEIVPYLASWPYLVIQGEPDRVDVVLEGYRAIAERVPASYQSAAPAAFVAPVRAAQAGATVERISASAVSEPAAPESMERVRRIERVKVE